MNDLKPCPFCGGKAKLATPNYEHYYLSWCKCTQCGAEGLVKVSDSEAIEEWNRRIENAPADVVHGRWVYEHDDPAMMPCSVCGYQVFRYNNTRYCPNCGAKMDDDDN